MNIVGKISSPAASDVSTSGTRTSRPFRMFLRPKWRVEEVIRLCREVAAVKVHDLQQSVEKEVVRDRGEQVRCKPPCVMQGEVESNMEAARALEEACASDGKVRGAEKFHWCRFRREGDNIDVHVRC